MIKLVCSETITIEEDPNNYNLFMVNREYIINGQEVNKITKKFSSPGEIASFLSFYRDASKVHIIEKLNQILGK